MLQPLFTYQVRDTTWLIVVAKGASHFYFDCKTGTSVWQLFETNVEDFANKVNFDELAMLFAKANGLRFEPRVEAQEMDAKKRKSSIKINQSKRQNIGDCSDDFVTLNPESKDTDEPLVSQNKIDIEKSETIIHEDPEMENGMSPHYQTQLDDLKQQGLDLGYSSSEDDEELGSRFETNNHGSQDQIAIDSDSDNNEGINSGLDLAFDFNADDDNVKTSVREDFENLLESLKDEISEFDPWFLLEEELMPKLSQSAAFYGIPTAFMREKIFDEWMSARNKEKNGSQINKLEKYPTPRLIFYRFLQNFKSEVRKMYYSDFYKKHVKEIEVFLVQNPSLKTENLYREFRVTINDFSDHERAKKERKKEGNLKVAHVEAFLRKKLANHKIGKIGQQCRVQAADFFDRWIQLCNDYLLPETVISDATNFIVGDEKRLGCYLRVLGLD